jgi:hypothetical protein
MGLEELRHQPTHIVRVIALQCLEGMGGAHSCYCAKKKKIYVHRNQHGNILQQCVSQPHKNTSSFFFEFFFSDARA